MSLRRAVMVAVISASLLIVGLLIHLARSGSASRALDESSRLSNAITTSVAELDRLVHEFMLHPHARPVQQWHILSEDLQRLFARLDEVGGPDQRAGRLRSEHMQARELFDTIVADAKAQVPVPNTAVVRLRRSRLAEQMMLVSRALVNHANAIHRASLREQSRIKHRDDAITIAALGATVGLLVWLLAYVQRQVLTRLETLRLGAERAAGGQMDVRLGDQRDDELGRLSRSFDNLLSEVRSSRVRLREEAGLRASEERQRQLIDALPGLFWAARPDGTIDTSNRLWREQFEVTPDAPGYDWTELLHPNDLAAWKSAWASALANGTGFEIEFRLRRRDDWRWHLTRVAPLADDQGRIQRWVCKAVDINHHKQLEQHLRNSRNQAELLNQVGLDLVGELDIDRLTQRVTDTARALVEADFAALFYQVDGAMEEAGDAMFRLYAVSGLPREAFDGAALPAASNLFRPIQMGEGVMRCDDIRQDLRFGRLVPHGGAADAWPAVVSYLAVPVRTRSGAIIGGLFCGHGQPAQFTVQHERLLLGVAALAATAFDSARLVDAERRHRRLADQRSEQLARSNAELEQFAYICSHDLQEPLRMVTSFLSLLEDRHHGQLDERGLDFVRRAIEGSSRMQKLVRDILAFSRVGRGERAEEILSLDEVVDEALANLQTAIEQTGARIERSPLPKVRANRLQCVQLYQNLIGNALKFCGDETPVVRLTARLEDHRWQLAVSDNGIGIDPAHHQRIFQVFQRLHGRDQFDGTGIGLSLCQKIVLAHGGALTVESQSGQGATFRFSLPDPSEEDQTPSSGIHAIVSVAGTDRT